MKKEKKILIPEECATDSLWRIPARAIFVLLLTVACIGRGIAQTLPYQDSPLGVHPAQGDARIFKQSLQTQSNLWYITRGHQARDVSWGIDIDSTGNIWWATSEVVPPSQYWDIFIYKLDSDGQQLWRSQPWGGPFLDVAFITVVKEPFVYVGGGTHASPSPSSSDALLLAYQMQGDTLALQWAYTWDQNNGYEEVDGILVENDALYLSGWTTPNPDEPFKTDIFVQKLDLNGNLLWDTTWGSSNGGEGANGHMVADANNLYITSHYGPFPFGDAALVCFSKVSGNYQWHTTWSSAPLNPFVYDDFYGLAMGSDSFLYALGPTAIPDSNWNLALVKYTRTGQVVWDRIWGGSGQDYGRAIVTSGDSLIYIAANTDSYGAGNKDIVVMKYDSSGNLLSYKTWGGFNFDVAHDVTVHGDYLYIAGETMSFGMGDKDALLLKINGRTMGIPDTIVTAVNEPVETNLGVNVQNIQLFQNYPNPFNSRTTIHFSLLHVSQVTLKVFDVLGSEVATLVDGDLPAGEHTIPFAPRGLASGLYFYQLSAGKFTQTRRALLMK